MPVTEILKLLTPILFITLAGFVFGKFKRIELKTLADVIIYVCVPALALVQLSMQRMPLPEILGIALSTAFVIIALGGIAYLLFRVLKLSAPPGIYLPIMFMNSGFIGYPLALFAFGGPGLSRAIVYDITNAVLIFTLGIYMVSRGKRRWEVLRMPFIYAALAGILISLAGIQLPQFIYAPLYLIGGMTIPLALFMLGCRLASLKITSWRLPLMATSLRLGLGLGLGMLAAFIFRLPALTAKIVILSSSLASAVTPLALAEEYDADPQLVASAITLSTLVSMVTVVLVLRWLILP